MKTYRSRYSFILSDEQAQAIGNELSERFPKGSFDAQDIVTIAKQKDSALHDFLEWDDSKAAERYRLQQARQIIKCLVVDISGKETPAFHNVYLDEFDHQSYIDVVKCQQSESLWSQVIQAALNEVTNWSKRYADYQELAPIHVAIKQTKESIK